MFQVITILGAARIGKSTLLNHLFEGNMGARTFKASSDVKAVTKGVMLWPNVLKETMPSTGRETQFILMDTEGTGRQRDDLDVTIGADQEKLTDRIFINFVLASSHVVIYLYDGNHKSEDILKLK
jgi:GTPase Era involved in 16S rRNA processing